jgi:nitrate reductase NapA
MAAATTVTAVSVGAPGISVGALSGASRETAPDPVWRKAPCQLCGVGCGLLVGIQNGRAVAVKGDPESPVSKGLACAKGYFSVQALYGQDRITRALIRRDGARAAAPIGEALDLVARRLRETVSAHGKDSVAIYGSAQWSIADAYVASRLFKGALGTNNVESSSRLHAAAAMAGLVSTFGRDGSVGCYDDIEEADVFVLWDINLAESDPVLFSRMLARRRADPAVRIIDLATRTTRTSFAADQSVLHAPHSTAALANAICHEIVSRGWADRSFVDRHVAFKRGRTKIGYGLSDDALVVDEAASATWNDYVAFLADHSPERVVERTGVPAASTRWLASLYGDRTRKVVSVWGANVNQHARGTWLNNLLYNIHLLVGKVATPGSGPLCLTAQPSGGASVHDAGTLTHTLPHGRVESAEDRGRAAAIWGVPVERVDPRPTHDALSLMRSVERGEIRFLWVLATDPMASLPNLDRYRRAVANGGLFLVVSDTYPTATTALADVVLPSAMWIEREGLSASVERRVQHFEQMVAPPGDAMSDAWQMIEVGRRLGSDARFPWAREIHVERIWDEYRQFHDGPESSLPPFAALKARPGVRWPFVDGRETRWRFNTAHDPAADRARGAFDFYGHPDGRAWIWLRPHEPPAESPDREYPFWFRTGEVLEHSGTGSVTRRIPTLNRAVPHAYLEMHADDARALGIHNGDSVRVTSRRGAITLPVRIDYRSQPPRGQLFAPSFDETSPVHRLTLDARCPLSGQPDTTTCAVRVERIGAAGGA